MEVQESTCPKPEMELQGTEKSPYVVQVGTIGPPLGWAAQQIKGEPDEGLSLLWDTQWQMLLKGLQVPDSGRRTPQMAETVPQGDLNAGLTSVGERAVATFSGAMQQTINGPGSGERRDCGKVLQLLCEGTSLENTQTPLCSKNKEKSEEEASSMDLSPAPLPENDGHAIKNEDVDQLKGSEQMEPPKLSLERREEVSKLHEVENMRCENLDRLATSQEVTRGKEHLCIDCGKQFSKRASLLKHK
ncbi:hypothetical protein lerEdw1_001516, partial [Lerista edwardsae]